jgi:branched-subunit amino acid aminotransferase/4-amino-4-deoxychorismate lyase
VLQLASSFPGVTVRERRITLAEILSALAENRLKEMFLTGTAVTVAPVGGLRYNGNVYMV